MQQIARSTVPREGLGNLLRRPSRGGMGGDVEMPHSTPMMGQNQKDKQNSKAQGRDYEEIRRNQVLWVAKIPCGLGIDG